MNQDDLKAAAQRTYDSLKPVFSRSGNYWQLGHTFDTVIDYFLATGPQDGESAAFGKLALQRYAVTQGDWYDDYAWWAIANLRAAENNQLFGDDSARFLNNCLDGWNRMSPCTATWQEAQSVPELRGLKPAVDHGVWNHHYATGSDAYNPINLGGNPLGAFQNTVTNSLYLVLSSRLSRFKPDEASYRAASDNEYGFLSAWLTMNRPGFEPLLNVFPGDKNKAVVRERISSYDSGVPLRGYRSNLAWTGDQGLVVGGLAERMEMVQKNDPGYGTMLSWVRKILAGVRDYMAVDSLLLPWWPDPPPGYDPDDYRTGPAVFMRYLLYVYLLHNEDLREDLAPYRGFVHANAERVVRYPSTVNDHIDQSMVALANDLAVLTSAMVMA